MEWDISGDRIALKGVLNEQPSLNLLVLQVPNVVTFDVSGVVRITSVGVLRWVGFLRALEQRGVRYAFEKCSIPFVGQLNAVSNFRGTGEVRSILAPYRCESCDREEIRLVFANADAKAQIEAPFPCPRCGQPMVFEDVAESYVAFVTGS